MDHSFHSSSPFHFRNGNLYCENLEVRKLIEDLKQEPQEICILGKDGDKRLQCDTPSTPVYIYSSATIQQNVSTYLSALDAANLKGVIGYAIKANHNIQLVKKMKSFGVSMIIAVSGYEVLAAIEVGFEPEDILLNGNGKQEWEIKLAIELGVMMNVDSIFDATQITEIHKRLETDKKVQVLLRMRPINGGESLLVHEFLNTAENSKFGFDLSDLDEVLEILSKREEIVVLGIHCHFGSSIGDPSIFKLIGETTSHLSNELRKRDIVIKIADVGGGVGIDYFEIPCGFNDALNLLNPEVSEKYYTIANSKKKDNVSKIPDFIQAMSSTLPKDVTLILEPGRSLIGNAGILLCKVLGTKATVKRKIMVVDGSMNEVIRPCLYGAHHNILPITVEKEDMWEPYDVVGPICESADFLGKHVPLQKSTKYVAVMDCGAYCSSMASNYNLKPRAAEVLVDNDNWTFMSKRDSFEQIIRH